MCVAITHNILELHLDWPLEPVYFFKDFTYFYREQKGGKHQSHAPNRGPGLQPSHVSWLGTEPVTFGSTDKHSIHWAMPARAGASLHTHQRMAHHVIITAHWGPKSALPDLITPFNLWAKNKSSFRGWIFVIVRQDRQQTKAGRRREACFTH